MLLSTTFLVNLLSSAVVMYLFSISDIFALHVAFLTKLLTSGILFSTTVNAELVAKPLILYIWLSISLIVALYSVFWLYF